MKVAGDLETKVRANISKALEELKAEEKKLKLALNLLSFGITPSPGSPLRSDEPKATRRKAKRAPKGQREAQFLAAVKDKPGITVAEIARKVGVSPPNSLYTLAKRLVKQGKVVKHGAGYKLKVAAPKIAPKKAAAKKAKPAKRKKG